MSCTNGKEKQSNETNDNPEMIKKSSLVPLKMPEPQTIESTETDRNDSSYFSLISIPNGIELRIRNQKKLVLTRDEIKQFIDENQGVIDRKKVLMIIDAKADEKKFELINTALKESGFSTYQMLSR
jgi:hypothetical protein